MNTFVKIGLGVAIAVVFPLMVGFGIEAFYPSPKTPYDKCSSLQNSEYTKCIDDQTAINQTHNRNLFIVTTIIGFIAIAGGALYLTEEAGPIAPGVVFGGLLTILYGAIRGFDAVDKRWLFLELTILLIGLILVTRRYLAIAAKNKNDGN